MAYRRGNLRISIAMMRRSIIVKMRAETVYLPDPGNLVFHMLR